MHSWWLLAAQRIDFATLLWRFAVPLTVFVIWCINQIVNRKGQPKTPRTAPRRPPMPDAGAKRAPAAGRPAAPQKTDPLLAEIQKFLKQSNPDQSAAARPLPP